MISDDQNYILMFNGEVYNHQELRKSLENKSNLELVTLTAKLF